MAAIAEHDPLTNGAFGVARVARPVLDGDCPVKARQPQAPETTTLAALLPFCGLDRLSRFISGRLVALPAASSSSRSMTGPFEVQDHLTPGLELGVQGYGCWLLHRGLCFQRFAGRAARTAGLPSR
jgi:hypothetical protein